MAIKNDEIFDLIIIHKALNFQSNFVNKYMNFLCFFKKIIRKLSKQECQKELIKWATKSIFKRSGPARMMHINQIDSYNTFKYILKTFTEKRGLICKYSDCKPGERIDTIIQGECPDPFSLPCNPDKNFEHHSKYIDIPHSQTLAVCVYYIISIFNLFIFELFLLNSLVFVVIHLVV